MSLTFVEELGITKDKFKLLNSNDKSIQVYSGSINISIYLKQMIIKVMELQNIGHQTYTLKQKLYCTYILIKLIFRSYIEI